MSNSHSDQVAVEKNFIINELLGPLQNGTGSRYPIGVQSSAQGIDTDALVMNNLVGAEPSGEVDSGDAATAVNFLPVPDVTQWNTFTITFEAGGTGTHIVSIWVNDATSPQKFDVTVGTGLEANAGVTYPGGLYIAIGSSGTGGITAFDSDIDTLCACGGGQ